MTTDTTTAAAGRWGWEFETDADGRLCVRTHGGAVLRPERPAAATPEAVAAAAERLFLASGLLMAAMAGLPAAVQDAIEGDGNVKNATVLLVRTLLGIAGEGLEIEGNG